MKWIVGFIVASAVMCCSPKGPETYNSPFIGKTKAELIESKGVAKDIKIYDDQEVYIYKSREEYFGKIDTLVPGAPMIPKKILEVEHIYYINGKGKIYKYQVWGKRLD